MYFGYLNVPDIGRSILGDADYQELMARLKTGEHAIFIVSTGTGSFKGSGFVRGGILRSHPGGQGLDTFTFRDLDYLNLYGIAAAGAPRYRESGIFIIRNPSFSAAYPWSLVFLGNRVDKQTGAHRFASFEQEYWVPARYLEGAGRWWSGRRPAWVSVWKARNRYRGVRAVPRGRHGGLRARATNSCAASNRKDNRWVDYPDI